MKTQTRKVVGNDSIEIRLKQLPRDMVLPLSIAYALNDLSELPAGPNYIKNARGNKIYDYLLSIEFERMATEGLSESPLAESLIVELSSQGRTKEVQFYNAVYLSLTGDVADSRDVLPYNRLARTIAS